MNCFGTATFTRSESRARDKGAPRRRRALGLHIGSSIRTGGSSLEVVDQAKVRLAAVRWNIDDGLGDVEARKIGLSFIRGGTAVSHAVDVRRGLGGAARRAGANGESDDEIRRVECHGQGSMGEEGGIRLCGEGTRASQRNRVAARSMGSRIG